MIVILLALAFALFFLLLSSTEKPQDSSLAVVDGSSDASSAESDTDEQEVSENEKDDTTDAAGLSRREDEDKDGGVAFGGMNTVTDFNFNTDNYTFRNDEQLSAESRDGGTLTAGATCTDVDNALILNLHYEGEKNHEYGVQISTESGNLGLLGIGSNAHFNTLSTSKWIASSKMQRKDDETLLYYRTWDQQLHAEFSDAKNYGLAWSYDEPEPHETDTKLLIRVCDSSTATVVDIFQLTISYDKLEREYYLSSLKSNPLCEDYNSSRLDVTSAVQKYVGTAAIKLIQSGALFYTADLKTLNLTPDDVIVQDVSNLFWCEASGYYGENVYDDTMELEGILVAATIRHTTDIYGPITLYYDVSFSGSKITGNLTFEYDSPTPIAYDYFGEQSWELFEALNGFKEFADSEKVSSNRTVSAYKPSWVE